MASCYSVLALLVVALSSSACVEGAQYRGVGFDTQYAPVYDDELRPWAPQPMNTTQVAEHVMREAVLSCMEDSPVQRAVICDILSWDSCGNIYGTGAEDKDWVVTSTNLVSGVVARLQSPVYHLRDGVSRFYFTPLEVGVYEIVVQRIPSSTLPDLYTNMTMVAHSVVHDMIADCSNRRMSDTLGQFQDTLWAESAYLNGLGRNAGMPSSSIQTSIVNDKFDIYDVTTDKQFQSQVRRQPIQQFKRDYSLTRLPADDNNQRYCDLIARV